MRNRPLLASAFCSSWPGSPAPAEADEEAIEEALRAILASARSAWPGIEVEDASFAGHVAARLPGTAPWKEELARVQGDDLYLACACFRGDPRACAALDSRHLAEVPRWLARIDRSADFADEIRQRLRERLLVGEAGTPKIGEYAGRGPLGGWVRVTAIRTALNVRRGVQRERAAPESAAPAVSLSPDPELALLKAKYSGEVQRALEEALRSLDTDRRNVLRMHYFDDLSIDEIGLAYGVHRSTAARWIAESREAIVDETKRRLGERIAASGSEVSAILGLVQSQLEVSLRTLL